MNLFYLSHDPEESVRYLCDKHVVKMTLETAQLLCGVHHMLGSKEDFPLVPYKLTHKNHPVAVWARACYNNYRYLSDYFDCISKEYTLRYSKEHLAFTKCKYLKDITIVTLDTKVPFSDPPLCMPEEYKITKSDSKDLDTVESYRAYYRHKMTIIKPFRYTMRSCPQWLETQ